MCRKLFSVVASVLMLACTRPDGDVRGDAPASFVIVNARLVDGTGGALRQGAVRIVGDRVRDVGAIQPEPGEAVIDAAGLVLAPGFIDTHSHADRGVLERTDALAALSQGITTIIGGQDGGSPIPLAAFFDAVAARSPAVNVAMYTGHGSLRRLVMGDDFRRRATAAEIDSMRKILRTELAAGALGLSTGLEYDPGIYSATEEVITLAKDVAAVGGRYISHLRSEDRAFWGAVNEIIRIGREGKLPVQISHTKLAMRSLWGKADSLIVLLDAARKSGVEITADIYPYLYWQSTLTVLFPERNFEDRKAAAFALTETSTPQGLLLGAYAPNPEYQGKTVADVARMRGVDSVTALIDLIRDAEAMKQKRRSNGESAGDVETVIGTSMVEEDVERIMRWEHTTFCTDGGLQGEHPRGFGSYPRIFGRYVRDRRVMSLEEAVRRATSLAAHNVGLQDRGTIAPGAFADLVLFDPDSIIDRATTTEPHAVSEGVKRVWVNGTLVFENGAVTAARPGRVLRRSSE